ITKFVNALSAASEVGGPAACASLLGFSDHYTDHSFKVFFWKGYVRRASVDLPAGFSADFENIHGDQCRGDERVVVGTSGSDVVPLSKVNDYVFRPRECSHMCLYDFLRSTDVRQTPKRKSEAIYNFASPAYCDEAEEDSDLESEGGDAHLPADGVPPGTGKGTSSCLRFQRGHPLVGTHSVQMREEPYTLNFCGGPLPRPDRGDREEYCFTMLVLFAPGGWRTGSDLLNKATAWTEAFERTEFAAEHRQVMKNMNVLYECQDARDDYAA
ncbi:hypothetical protein OH77DRAFT_1376469, partial [Trametes cingulata]